MIEATPEPLLREQDKALRAWLNKTECATLKRVVDGKCKLAEIQAHLDAHKAMSGDANYSLTSNDSMKQAHKYQTFLDVLEEITNQPPDELHQIVKLR